MIGAVRTWWSTLSLRERVLVGMAGALVGGLVGWYLIVVPLNTALASAAEAHAAALDRRAAIGSRVAALRQRSDARPTATSPVSVAVDQAAAEVGLPLARNDPAGDGGAAIAIAAGRSTAILTLLHQLDRTGIQASDLALRRNGDGTLALTGTFRRSAR
jgi:general secretion pathway protein M